MVRRIHGRVVNEQEFTAFKKAHSEQGVQAEDWKAPAPQPTVTISARRAKEMGVDTGGASSVKIPEQQLRTYEAETGHKHTTAAEAAPPLTTQPTTARPTIQLTAPEKETGILGAIGADVQRQERMTALGLLSQLIQPKTPEHRGAEAVISGAIAIAAAIPASLSIVGAAKTAATVGKVIPHINVEKVAAQYGLTKAQTAALAREIGRRRISQVAAQVTGYAVNGQTQVATMSLMQKAGMTMGAAAIVGTVVGTYPFAEFELAEATDKIGIAMFKAANEGDWETVEELSAYLDEMVNLSTWEQIISKIPFANVIQSVRKNIEAAKVSSDVYKKLAAEAQDKPSEEEKWADMYAEQEERTIRQRAEAEAYYEGIEEKKASAKEEEREADEEYYNRIAEEKRESELTQRAEDEKYWARMREEETVRKTEERAADEAYWADIYAKNEARKAGQKTATKPELEEIKGSELTPSEYDILKAWNAGKSALSFGWLGN